MPEGDLITRPYQAELQGVLMGAITAYPFGKRGLQGFGLPSLRDSDTPRPQDHGVFVGPDFMESKPLTFDLGVWGDTPADIEELLIELEEAWAPITDTSTIALVFRLAGDRLYRVHGRPRRFALDLTELKSATASAVALFVATDPRLYDNDEQHGATGPGSGTGGLGFPHGFPHGFGSTSPGSVDVLNEGNIDTYPRAVITAGVGGISGFAITVAETGLTFIVDLVMVDGDTLELDFLDKTVTLNGTASRIGARRLPDSDWLYAPPGLSTWSFTVNGAGTATLDLFWRSAFLI